MKIKLIIFSAVSIILLIQIVFLIAQYNVKQKTKIKTTTQTNPEKKKYDLNYKFYKDLCWTETTVVTSQDSYDDKLIKKQHMENNYKIKFNINNILDNKPKNIQATLLLCQLDSWIMNDFIVNEWVIARIRENKYLKIDKYSDKLKDYIEGGDDDKNSSVVAFSVILIETRILLPEFSPKKKCAIGDSWEKDANLILLSYPIAEKFESQKIKLTFDKVVTVDNLEIAKISYSSKFKTQFISDPNEKTTTNYEIKGNIEFNVTYGQIIKNEIYRTEYTQNFIDDKLDWGCTSKTDVVVKYKFESHPDIKETEESQDNEPEKPKGADE